MSCCGNGRSKLYGENPVTGSDRTRVFVSESGQGRNGFPGGRYSVIIFEYTGKTGMTAYGPVSGNRYRFERPGMRLVVDPRDRPALKSIPNLVQVFI